MATQIEWDESMVRHDAEMIMDRAWNEVGARIGGAHLLELVALDQMQKWIETQRAAVVTMARFDDEHTWTEIGYALGVSKQAAAKKFGQYQEK